MSAKIKTRRELALRPATLRVADRMTRLSGTIEFPALPALCDHITQKLADLFSGFSRPFEPARIGQLRDLVARALDQAYQGSSASRIAVNFSAEEGHYVNFDIDVRHVTVKEKYEALEAKSKAPLFGRVPDAMVMSAAAQLGERAEARVLDVGAGDGRNAVPLARLGHPITAIEPTPAFSEQLRKAANDEQLPVTIVAQDFLSPECVLERGHYRLVVISEVLTHFGRLEGLRTAFSRVADALSPGGVVVANVFVAEHWYKPEPLARQIGEMVWSCFFTEPELDFITTELPFEKITDEPVLDYERERAPKTWPPTGWFEDWANGRNVFETTTGISAPIELRWLVFRRLP
jgi:2-polyprenyl-3-methyl-5-hydroxy-6-metoxy-1,4-benzoquinol methylase